MLLGWANYFRFSECSEIFNKVDHIIWKILRKWVNHRSIAAGRIKAWNKYFPGTETTFYGKIYKDKYVLKSSFNSNKKIFLPKLIWIKSQKWIKIKSNSSPYDRNKIYWAKRKVSYSGFTILQSKLLIKQKFLCPQCGGEINVWSHIEVYNIKSISKNSFDKTNNKQVLHKICYIEKISKEVEI